MELKLNEYLDSLEKAKGNRRAALNNYNAARADYAEAFSPLGGMPTMESLKHLYELCVSNNGFTRSHIFICSALLFYNPEALYGGKIKIKLAKMIANVLGVTHSSVYIARKKVSIWLMIYTDFSRIIHSVFENMQKYTNEGESKQHSLS